MKSFVLFLVFMAVHLPHHHRAAIASTPCVGKQVKQTLPASLPVFPSVLVI